MILPARRNKTYNQLINYFIEPLPYVTLTIADKSQDYFIESKTILKGLQKKSLAEHEQPGKQ